MSKTVTLTIGNTQKTPLPAGKTFQGFKFSLVASDGTESGMTTTETSVDFADAAPGTYTASVAAVDQDGAPLGAVATVEVVVPEDPSFLLPVTLTAAVA